MRLQFWVDYVLAAREQYVQLRSCRTANDPMRAALDNCFGKIDAAVEEAASRGLLHCTHFWRERGERVVLKLRREETQISRTIAHVSSFRNENGGDLNRLEVVDVIVAIQNMIFWEARVMPDPKETWMPTGRRRSDQS